MVLLSSWTILLLFLSSSIYLRPDITIPVDRVQSTKVTYLDIPLFLSSSSVPSRRWNVDVQGSLRKGSLRPHYYHYHYFPFKHPPVHQVGVGQASGEDSQDSVEDGVGSPHLHAWGEVGQNVGGGVRHQTQQVCHQHHRNHWQQPCRLCWLKQHGTHRLGIKQQNAERVLKHQENAESETVQKHHTGECWKWNCAETPRECWRQNYGKTPDRRMLKARLYRNTTQKNAETAETSNRKTLKWCRNIKQEPAETSAEMPHRKLLKQYRNTKQENAQTVQKHQTGNCKSSAETSNRNAQLRSKLMTADRN